MKTLKTLFIISAILLVSGYSKVKGSTGPGDANSTVRERIASAIESADFVGKGQVTLKFGVTERNNLKIIKVESDDQRLTQTVKDALADANIVFPQGSAGTYQIKVIVNENSNYKFELVRNQINNAVRDLSNPASETVKLKFRVINPTTIQVVKADCSDRKLADAVKKAVEEQEYFLPKTVNGQYTMKVSFK